MKIGKIAFIFTFVFILTCTSCNNNRFQVDISDIDLTLHVSRFETDLFSADPAALEDYIPLWEEKYGVFFRHFNYVMGFGTTSSPGYLNQLQTFVTNPLHYNIYKRTMEVFPDLDTLVSGLENGFKRYHSFFPDRSIPRIISYVSGFVQTAISDEGLLAIGLDNYLGSDEELYDQAGIYQYLKDNMHPDKVIPDCLLFWAETEFSFNDSVNNLVSNMIHRGKLMYLVRALLPEEPDSLIWGFTGDGMRFCINNEEQMWTYLIGNKLLFNSDRFTINKFIQEGPFTNDFSTESPAKAAIWLGYKIVESYMDRFPAISMQDLMQNTQYMEILNLSAYNP